MTIKKTLKRLGSFFRGGAEALDPQKADPRAFEPPHGTSYPQPVEPDPPRPDDPPIHPDIRGLEGEHRGY